MNGSEGQPRQGPCLPTVVVADRSRRGLRFLAQSFGVLDSAGLHDRGALTTLSTPSDPPVAFQVEPRTVLVLARSDTSTARVDGWLADPASGTTRRSGALPLPLDDPRLVGATAAGGGVQLLASHLERSPRLLLETYLVTLAVNCGRGQGTVPAPQAPARRRQQ